MSELTDEHKRAIVEAVQSGYQGIRIPIGRASWDSIGRKLLVVEEFPEPAYPLYGMQEAEGCLWIGEESDV